MGTREPKRDWEEPGKKALPSKAAADRGGTADVNPAAAAVAAKPVDG